MEGYPSGGGNTQEGLRLGVGYPSDGGNAQEGCGSGFGVEEIPRMGGRWYPGEGLLPRTRGWEQPQRGLGELGCAQVEDSERERGICG